MNPANFIKEVRTELNRVVWPTRDQVARLTITVIVISAIVSAFIGALDYVFTTATQYLI